MKLTMFALPLVVLISTFGCSVMASEKSIDRLLDLFSSEKKAPKTAMRFHGLHFKVDSTATDCTREGEYRLSCLIAKKDSDGQIQARAQLVFAWNAISSSSSLPLIRIKRKEAWFKEHPSINQYVEEDVIVGSFKARLQRCRYFRLDNIHWPVLIRTFDVVVDERTSISVTTISDVRDWPAIEKEISSIELSFSKAAK